MARKLVKRDWGQAKGGYTPFAKSSPKAAKTADTSHSAESFDRVTQNWFTQK